MCYVQKYLLDPTVAEAFGAQLEDEFGRYMGFPSFTLEGDAKEVVLALGRGDGGMGKFGVLFWILKIF
jgi:hypothetical protein